MASKASTLKAPGRAPGKLSSLLDTLYNEHRYILSLLDNLEQQSLRLKSGKVPDYQLLLDSIDYLTHYPDRYHHSREDLLFAGIPWINLIKRRASSSVSFTSLSMTYSNVIRSLLDSFG